MLFLHLSHIFGEKLAKGEGFFDDRLVNRRVEQRQEHSVTHTQITQRYDDVLIVFFASLICAKRHHVT